MVVGTKAQHVLHQIRAVVRGTEWLDVSRFGVRPTDALEAFPANFARVVVQKFVSPEPSLGL